MVNCIKRILLTASAVISLALLASCGSKDEYVVISGFAQGGTYMVKFNLNGREGRVKPPVEEIRDSIDAILLNIDRSLSGYNKGSLLSRLNAGRYFGIFRGKKRWQIIFFMYFKNLKYTAKQVLHRIKFVF